jgi:hypothetical protein
MPDLKMKPPECPCASFGSSGPFVLSIVPHACTHKTVAQLVVEWKVCLCLFDVVWLILVCDEKDLYIYKPK